MKTIELPTIEEKQITIAEFHGWTKRKVGKGTGQWWWDFGAWGRSNWSSGSFHYYDSWDWIMPVWIKFRNADLDLNGKYGDWVSSLQWYLFSAYEPKDFAERMFYAIKWINQQSTLTPLEFEAQFGDIGEDNIKRGGSMNKARITCPECGKRMYSLGFARHRAMHRDERIEAERIEKLKMKYIPENKSSNRA